MQIQISWLLQKPTDLDLHCLQRQGISGFSRTRVNTLTHIYICQNSTFINLVIREMTWQPNTRHIDTWCQWFLALYLILYVFAFLYYKVFGVPMKKLCIPGYSKCTQWKFWLDCTNVPSNLSFHWVHIPEGTVSDVLQLALHRGAGHPFCPFLPYRCLFKALKRGGPPFLPISASTLPF